LLRPLALRPREDDECDEDDLDELPFVRPSSFRRLFTVRAAISFARPVPFSLSLMCSYIRSSLLLQDFGMAFPLWRILPAAGVHSRGRAVATICERISCGCERR
jgi:hypothetical protein